MILLTGGSGRLGSALQKLLPATAPSRLEWDICNFDHHAIVQRYQPSVLVHAAAYTNVVQAEHQRELCWNTNVLATRSMVKLAMAWNVPLVHISTDYVFWGDVGNHLETDTPGPVRNFYALSKLVAEEAVLAYPRSLVVRTSFRTWPWPYALACTDLVTSQDYLHNIAPDIALAIKHLEGIPHNMVHIAGPARSAFELAQLSRPDVQPALRQDMPVALPECITLNQERWNQIKAFVLNLDSSA